MGKSLSWSLLLLVFALGLWACEDKKSLTEPPPVCTYSLSKTSLSFGAPGGSDAVTVTTAASCTWSASSDRGWLSVTGGATGTGSGTVNVSAAANGTESSRSGTLTIGGQAVAFTQVGTPAVPCTFAIDPTSSSWNKDGGTRTFAVAAGDQCAWTARSNAPWIAITSGAQGTGNGSVEYRVDRNTNATERTGTITAADRTFTVSQSGDV